MPKGSDRFDHCDFTIGWCFGLTSEPVENKSGGMSAEVAMINDQTRAKAMALRQVKLLDDLGVLPCHSLVLHTIYYTHSSQVFI